MRRTDLPAMKSCDGCRHEEVKNSCCTIVRATRAEAKRIKRYTEDNDIHWLVQDGIQCGFIQDGQCAIYKHRPWVCRAFGVVKQMPCSRFPQDAELDLSADTAIAQGLSNPNDQFLGAYFETGYYERMKVALAPSGYTLGVS